MCCYLTRVDRVDGVCLSDKIPHPIIDRMKKCFNAEPDLYLNLFRKWVRMGVGKFD